MRKLIVCAVLALVGCNQTTTSDRIEVTRYSSSSRPNRDDAPAPAPIKRIARVVIEFDDGTSAEAAEKK